MKHRIGIVLLVLLLIPMGLIAAQGEQEVKLLDGTILTLPEGWDYEEDEGLYTFSPGDSTYIRLMLPETLAETYDATLSAEEMLITIYADAFEQVLDEGALDVQEDGVEYVFEDDDRMGIALVLERNDGMMFVDFYAPVDDFESVQQVVPELLSPLMDSSMAGAPQPCYVSTDLDYGAPLRVGPGTNRGQFTSLMPADGQVLVIGRTEANDGSLWWRVEEDEPNANELWVADANVTTTGDCDQIGDTVAPPIVFAEPSAPAPSGSTGETQPEAEPADVSTDASQVPAAGRWNLTIGSEMLLSCEGGETERMPAPVDSGIVLFTVSAGGEVVSMTDASVTIVFNHGGDGYYVGNLPEPLYPNMFAFISLYVTAPTQMRGELAVGFTDIPCSGTVMLSFAYLG
ncbi:MAG: hypothetical protein GYB65_06060 [Chloroflexi bacterium]|nr:hypothetical protein [Chloroflexota bacterium]